ncbi:hypothetical protein [Paraconexibacter algicola]|uniref:Uncharacterized protein n=1 Tax=Paraconexibacter algicola TaxID=2133960 RepID=A0A2T4UBC4_9ACTN|nr:hypothetical protein [Paraconexibacter algicola]PTL54157.1 hypothetical protein C7Y72_22350 [Paraconexibacter algicola]
MRQPAPRPERLRRLAVVHAASLPPIWVAAATGAVPYLPFMVVAGLVALVATGPFVAQLALEPPRTGHPRAAEWWRTGFYVGIVFSFPVYLLYWWAYVRPRD